MTKPDRSSHDTFALPARGLRALLSVFLLFGALSFVLLRGTNAVGNLQSDAQLSQTLKVKSTIPPPPTLPPSATQTPITPQIYASYLTGTMSLQDKIAQMMMVEIYDDTLTSDDISMVRQHVGGVVLFGSSFKSLGQTVSLTKQIQGNSAPFPAYIATDQEGGNISTGIGVNRFDRIFGSSPSEGEIGQSSQTSQAFASGQQTAADFAKLGLNMNLAPVVDIEVPGVTTGYLFGRTYGTDPTVVSTMADSYLQGFQQSGNYIAVAKHFPGLGATSQDPDHTLPTVMSTQQELDANEFVPYRNMIEQGHLQAVMVTHLLYPNIDPTYPASLSYKITTGLLRDDLGFQGLIITDSLHARALVQYDLNQATLLATEAGADILLGLYKPDQVTAAIQGIVNAVQNGTIARSRIDASVNRILQSKIEMGLIPLQLPTTPTPSPTPTATPILAPSATPKY